MVLHWSRDPDLLERLAEHRFQVAVLARHPCDVLISILQFSLHHDPDRWLEGAGGNERTIVGELPTGAAFLDYATGPRARALLSISRQWWHAAVPVRYEDLLTNTQQELQRLVDVLGMPVRRSISEAIESCTLPNLRRLHAAVKHHFWQGQAGLWRRLIPAETALRIAEAHGEVFADLGYQCQADPDLTAEQAELNWYRLNWSRVVEDLQGTRDRLAVTRAQLAQAASFRGRLRSIMARFRGSSRFPSRARSAAE
jgi:hypothetical protein